MIKSFFNAVGSAIKSFFGFFGSPYPLNGLNLGTVLEAVIAAIVVSGVTLFLNPFEIEDKNAVPYSAGITFGVSILISLLAGFLLKGMSNSWTVTGQLIKQIIVILVAGSAINQIFKGNFGGGIATLVAVGAVLSLLYNYFNQSTVKSTNEGIASETLQTLVSKPVVSNSNQQFPLQGGGKNLNLLPNQIISVEKVGDSTNIHWQSMMKVENATMQIPFDKIANALLEESTFIKCSSSAVVNINAIKSLKGNAHGVSVEVAKTNQAFLVDASKIADLQKRLN